MTRFAPLAALLAGGLFFAAPAGARAGLLPVSVTVLPEAGNYRWTYAVTLPTDAMLQKGNFFTIYDFAGYIPGSVVTPDGWAVSSANVGKTPSLLRPQDSRDLPNVTFTYLGPTVPSGQIGLGNFSIASIYGNPTEDYFTAQTNRSSDGKVDRNITTTMVPDTPEPGTLLLAGLGLPVLGLARVIRRRGQTAVDTTA